MKAIAEFAMRSRFHAIGVSAIASALPLMGWLSSVVVALVCMRQGVAAGGMVLAWTLLPVGASLYVLGDPSPAIVLISTFVMATILRQTLSWELALVASVVLAGIGTVLFATMAPGVLNEVVSVYQDYQRQVDASLEVEAEALKSMLLGFFALGLAMSMNVFLIIGRWCQAALYNPGGFAKEFRALRLSPAVSTVIVVLMLFCYVFAEQLGRWLPLLSLPLLFAAIGLVHWTVTAKQLSSGWVFAFYASLVLLFQLVYPLLASVALMDSWLNLRNRILPIQKD